MVTIHQLISKPYQAQQTELHSRPKGYGGKGSKWADTVLDLVKRYEAWSVLDYGCGMGTLGKALRAASVPGLRIDEYDPAMAWSSMLPGFADLVVCTDVLEHIEPDRLACVLSHISMLARKAAFLVVALDPANKILSDGRNAHLIQQPPDWWESSIRSAGLSVVELDGLIMPPHYNPEKRKKRWIAVVEPHD